MLFRYSLGIVLGKNTYLQLLSLSGINFNDMFIKKSSKETELVRIYLKVTRKPKNIIKGLKDC